MSKRIELLIIDRRLTSATPRAARYMCPARSAT